MRPIAFRAIRPISARVTVSITAFLVMLAMVVSARAERPSAMKLFPENTLVFVRMANAREFGEKFQQTSMGRMIRDPQLKPFVDHLYGKVGDLYTEQVESKIGITWEDLKKLPQGEVAFAVVAREQKAPALLLMIDEGDELSVADKLVDRALDFADKAGADFSTEKIGDVEVTIVRDRDRKNRMLGIFERENTIVVGTDPDVLKNVLWHWDHAADSDSLKSASTVEVKAEATSADDKPKKDSDKDFVPQRTLAENSNFATILRECRRKQDPPPHLIVYVDPITLLNHIGRDNGGMQFALAMMPMIGIDGIKGLGAAITYATDEYDDLTQVHALLENPRSGVLQLPAFEPGDTAPQKFVPRAIESYLTLNWNLRTTYDRVGALVDRLGSKGTVDKFMKEKVSDKIGIDIVTQVIDNLKGRITLMIGYDRPSRLTGHQHTLAVELKDEKAMVDALKTVVAKFPDVFEEKHMGELTYYLIMGRRLREMPEDDRPAAPFVGIMDGYLFVGGSAQQFERCVSARDGAVERLIDSPEYARTSAVIGRETAGTTPVMFSMGRFEETVRQWYDLLTSPKTREQIDEHKEKNKFLAALAETLETQQLPPFEVLAPYFAPGGGILYDTDSGYHGISFTLRNKAER